MTSSRRPSSNAWCTTAGSWSSADPATGSRSLSCWESREGRDGGAPVTKPEKVACQNPREICAQNRKSGPTKHTNAQQAKAPNTAGPTLGSECTGLAVALCAGRACGWATAPGRRTSPRWPPWPGATRPRCRGTRLWSPRGRRRSRYVRAPSRARS